MRVRPTFAAAVRALLLGGLLLPGLNGCAHPPPPAAAASPPAIPEAAELAALAPRYRITLLDGGRTLEFLGEVTDESAADLGRMLALTPSLRQVSLTSAGGNLGAAIAAGDRLAERHLTTYVPLACISACTLLFVAGEQRLLAPDARLGFHAAAPAVAAMAGNRVVAAYGNDLMRDWLLRRGIAVGFLDQVLAVAHERVWYPAAAELRQAGVVTGRGPARAASSLADAPAALTEWVFLNEPLFLAMAVAYPQDYRRLGAEVYAAFQAGADDLAIERLSSAGAAAALQTALPRASDAVLLRFFEILHDTISAQRDADPRTCRSLLSPDEMLLGLDEGLQMELGDRIAETLALVFLSVARAPAPPVSRADYDAAWSRLARQVWDTGILRESDRALLQHPEQAPQRYCTVALAVLDSLLAAPAPERAVILRGLVQFP
jgi:hypothetical protein